MEPMTYNELLAELFLVGTERDAALARVAELEAALRPFALIGSEVSATLNSSDCRRAARLLKGIS